MIYLYSGTPGSGKSLHTADKLYWRLRAGKPVIANFAFRWQDCGKNPHYLYINNMDLTPERLINFSRNWFSCHRFHEGAITLVIDESQILFNSRDWNAAGRGDWLSNYTQLRNYGYEVIDLGKDVQADKIIAAAKEHNASIIVLSALMTTTMMRMKDTIALKQKENLNVKVMIGGAVTTQSFADEIGADGYSKDAADAVRLAKKLLSE